MIIERLDLIAFGRFGGESLDLSAAPRRFHLVYGPNESGKSTCLRAISALLFGIPTRTVDAYQHASAKLRIGAKLVDRNGQPLTIIRRKNGASKLYAQDDKTPVDPSLLEQMLGGIDEATFHHRFGLSHEQLVAGGQAVLDSKGELGEILFAAGAGVGTLRAIQSELESESKALFLERGKKTINTLLAELDAKRKTLRELQTQPAEYQLLRERLSETERESKDLAEQRVDLSRTLAKRKSYREACAIVPVWKRHQERVNALSTVPMLDEDFAARRREAAANLQTYHKLVLQGGHETEEIQQRIDDCPIDSAILEHDKEIVSMFQGIAAREAACRDQENLGRVVKNHNRHLRELLRDLDFDVDEQTTTAEVDRIVQSLHVSDTAQLRIGELAGDFEMLRQQERDSLESLMTLKKQLAELDEEIERSPGSVDPGMIESVLSETGAPAVLLDQEEQQSATCQELELECDRLMQELKLNGLSVSDAVGLQCPTLSSIDDHDQKLDECRRNADDAEKLVGRLRTQQRQARQNLNQLQADQLLPTEVELLRSRQNRDECVDRLDACRADESEFRSQNRSVRKSIHDADHLVDTMRLHQELVTRRATITAEITRLDDDIAGAEETAAASGALAQLAQNDWRQLWESCGIAARSVREMRHWISRHQTLCDNHRSLERERGRLQATRSRIHRMTSRLSNAVQHAWADRPIAAGISEGIDGPTEDMTLEALHDCATALRNELAATASHMTHLNRKRNEILAAIPPAEAKFETNAMKRKQWDQDWKQAVASFSADPSVSPSVIGTRLKKIAKLFEQTRERDIILGRIRSIDDDGRVFAERASVIAGLVGLKTSEDQRSVQIAQLLYDRLQDAKVGWELAQRLRNDLTKARQQLENHSLAFDSASAQLAELCREARVGDRDQLPEIEQRSSEKRNAVQALASAEQQLALIAGGESVETLTAEVESLDASVLDSEISEIEKALEQVTRRWSTIEQQVGAIKKELSEIDGGDHAAELNQDIQLLIGRLQRESQHYAKLRISSMILRRSIEHYRSENESPVLKLACEAFEELTCGRYAGLKPEFDDKGRSKLFGIEKSAAGDENLIPVEAMSLGTADALYLAMRLASLEHQLSAGQAIPVVIDDCLIQLDDLRTIAAMKRFSRLSQRTQVILFTHHQHLIELAESAMSPGDFHLHRLES